MSDKEALKANNETLSKMNLNQSKTIAALQSRVKELVGLLKVSSCPQCGPNKDGAYYDNMGEVHQCQWCYEVNAALQKV